MPDSFLPPVTVELVGKDDGFTSVLTKSITTLERLGAAVELTATQVDEAFKSMLASAESLGGMVDMLGEAKTAMQAVARATRSLGAAADQTATKVDQGFALISESADSMATAVADAAATAETAVAGIGDAFTTAAADSKAAAASIAASADGAATATAAASGRTAVASEGAAGSLMKYATGLAAAGFGVFEAIKGATKFNSEMTLLNTQAGVSKNKLASLGSGVLQLAGQIGQDPDSLAESLFHVESNFSSLGITGPKALNLVKIAAEGAKTGHADLVDVTNALTAAVASGIPGVQDYGHAMGVLNATVGAGDMTMQQLAESMAGGMVATVKGFGLSIQDVGAALATFGDNNIRGAQAGTQLRMSVMALADPVAGAGGALKKLGLSQDTLASDMRKGGLLDALQDLQRHMKNAGISAKEQGQVITEAFGRKAGAGLNVLMDQLPRLESKYPELEKGANNFGNAWKTTSHTVATEFDQMKGSLEALGIKLGEALLPPLTKVLGWIKNGIGWITEHKAAVQMLAAVLGGMLVAALYGVAGALMAIEINPVVAGITALVAGSIYAYTHFKTFRTVINDVARFLKTILVGAVHLTRAAIADLVAWWNSHKDTFIAAWNGAVKGVQAAVKWFNTNVIAWVKARVADLVAWWSAHSAEIGQVWSALWQAAQVAIHAWWAATQPVLSVAVGVFKAAWSVIVDAVKLAWGVISSVVEMAMHTVLNVIAVGLDIMTGHWSQAWNDAKKLVSQGFSDIIRVIKAAVGGFGTLLYDAGKNLIDGLINGIKSGANVAESYVESLGHKVSSAFQNAVKIFSPSRVFAEHGMNIVAGLVQGMRQNESQATGGSVALAAAVTDPFAQALGIASPSKKFKTFGGWIVYGLVQGLTGSTASVKAATKRLATDLYADFHGHTGLRNYVNRENAELLKLAKQRDSVATRLKAAQKNLKTLQTDWANEKSSIAQGIMQGMSAIAPDNADGRTLTSADVVANMRDQYQQAEQFAAQLQQLKKEGLSSSLIQQYADAGVDQAGATVAALASGPKSAIAQMNQYQKSLQTQANSVGTTVANSMYGAGINSAKGLIKGLQKQEKAIEAEMLKIAKSMRKTIEKALGIHSPSTVMAELGDCTAQGMAVGINRSSKQAAIAAAGMAMSVRQAAALGPGGAGMGVGAVATASQAPTNIYITVEGNAVTENQLVDSIETAMLRKGMRRPLTYTNYKR